MALPVNIDALLSGGVVEWERIEFKEGWNALPVLHTLCAFANDFNNWDGGYLVIGIATQDGLPVLPPAGLHINTIDKIQLDLLELGHKIQPNYQAIVEPCVVEGKHILIVRAPGGQNRPYKAPVSLSKDNKEYAYYIRRGSATVRANAEEERELFNLAAKIPFDDRTNQQAHLSDLKLSLIQSFLRDVGSELYDRSQTMALEAVCARMLIVDGPNEARLPRNVGLMFFNERPDRFFPQTQIDIVEMPDGPGGSRLIEKTITGPLSQMIRDALLYLNNSVLKEYVVKRRDRAEADRFFNYPYAALEELLVNAVYHRSYEEREPIEVRVLPDPITITSYPGPDRSIRIEDLNRGDFVARRYRNRRIGEFLKELRLTEGRGTGIPTAIRALEENGSPRPRFDTNEERTHLTVTLPIHNDALRKVTPQESETPQENTPQENTPQEVERKNIQESVARTREAVSTRRRTILEFCISPRDRASIQARIGLRDLKNLREVYLTPLLSDALLALTDPAQPTVRNQKYKTTDKGIAYLRSFEEAEREAQANKD